MKKIGEINPKNAKNMVIYYEDKAKNNPYRVYLEWHGYVGTRFTKRRELVEKYADLASCMLKMYHFVVANNEEGR